MVNIHDKNGRLKHFIHKFKYRTENTYGIEKQVLNLIIEITLICI